MKGLLPLFLSLLGAFSNKFCRYKQMSKAVLTSFESTIVQQMITGILPILLIPAYRFIAFPLLHNRPIKRAGAGLVSMPIGNLLNLTWILLGIYTARWSRHSVCLVTQAMGQLTVSLSHSTGY